MSQKRRDFLYNLSGLFIGGGLLTEKLGSPNIFSNSETVTPELSGTPLSNLSPESSKTHQINKMGNAYNIGVEWNRLDNTRMFYTFEIPTEVLETTGRPFVRNPISVYDNSIKKPIVRNLARDFEELFVNKNWKNAEDHTLERKTVGSKSIANNCMEQQDSTECIENIEMPENDLTQKKTNQPETRHQTVTLMEDDKKGSSEELELVPEIVRFIQTLDYKKDYKRDGMLLDYPQYPSETLYMGIGDCEDTAILLSTFLENLQTIDVRTALAFPPGHCAALAAIPDLPNSEKYTEYTTIDGVPYTFLETTNKVEIFGTPDSFKNIGSLFIYHNNTIKNINPGIFPATARKGLQIVKRAAMSYLP